VSEITSSPNSTKNREKTKPTGQEKRIQQRHGEQEFGMKKKREKKYFCDLPDFPCGKGFPDKNKLTVHQRIHRSKFW